MLYSDAKISSRKKTREGFLEVDAAVTRAGILSYHASEIGLEGDRTVDVRRTLKSVSDPETLSSIRRATVTVDHPHSDVTIDNWRSLAVGEVVGEPKISASGIVTAKLVIRDQSAIDLIESGIEELSIGYSQSIEKVGDSYQTAGPIVCNHVAIVEQGRAGPKVRIKDGGFPMNSAEIQAAVSQGVKDALAAIPGAQLAGNQTTVQSAVDSALQPVLAEIKDMSMKNKKKDMEEEEADMKKKAEDAADNLVKSTIAARDAYWDGIMACSAHLTDQQKAALKDKPLKDWLVAAVGDRIPNAALYDEATLRGALLGMGAAQQPAARPAPAGLPPGVGRPATDHQTRAQQLGLHILGDTQSAVGDQSLRDKARQAYIDRLTGAQTASGESQ